MCWCAHRRKTAHAQTLPAKGYSLTLSRRMTIVYPPSTSRPFRSPPTLENRKKLSSTHIFAHIILRGDKVFQLTRLLLANSLQLVNAFLSLFQVTGQVQDLGLLVTALLFQAVLLQRQSEHREQASWNIMLSSLDIQQFLERHTFLWYLSCMSPLTVKM